MSHLDSANIVPKLIVISKNWGMVHANSCRSDMSWVCIFFADFDVHVVPNILHVGEVRTVVCGLGATFINAPGFQWHGGIRPSEVHVFWWANSNADCWNGGNATVLVGDIVSFAGELAKFQMFLLVKHPDLWWSFEFPQFFVGEHTWTRFMAENRHCSWLNSKFFLGSPWPQPPPGSTATWRPLWWRTTRPALRARRATGGPGRCRSWTSYEESNRCRAFFHGKIMGKSWENDEHQGIFHGKMRAQGFFSWENHGKNMETKPSMNDICAIAMI